MDLESRLNRLEDVVRLWKRQKDRLMDPDLGRVSELFSIADWKPDLRFEAPLTWDEARAKEETKELLAVLRRISLDVSIRSRY